MRVPSVLLVVLLGLVGCEHRSPERRVEPKSAPTDAAKAKPPAPDATASMCGPDARQVSAAGRFDCTRDEDCVNNCAIGAVNKLWEGWLGYMCFDGCNQGGPPTCKQGKCDSGRTNGDCTQEPGPEWICVGTNTCDHPRKTDDRFDCASDADCVNTCGYGAINRTWFQLLGETCKDGCAEQGPPRCDKGHCVAQTPECTDRPAPEALCLSSPCQEDVPGRGWKCGP